MLRLFIILALVLTHPNVEVNAQRGGYGGGGGYGGIDGEWGENEEPPTTQVVTQTKVQTQVQTKVQTQTQVQTQVRTMVSTATALSVAPTTVVQVQATTVVKVNTVLSSIIVPLSNTPSTPSDPSISSSPPPSRSPANPDQSQSPLQQSEGLTVYNIPSSSQVEGGGITTSTIGAASEVSAPITRLTGTVATLKSGMEFRTTGIPNLSDGAQGVVYGHVSFLRGFAE